MSGIPVLLITANVGSIFEEPGVMLKVWTEEFLSTVAKLDPKFIALHCQEVGGKTYEQSMRHVEDFVRLLMSSEELRLFDKVRVFLDEDFSSAENFTALGNFYFIHESLKDVHIWDFQESIFIPVCEKEVHSGNIESVTTKEKSKFPQDFFPECKWSRKGFLRTRWNISGTVFDLINIHLFHDASNFIAMETFPSVYSKTRRRALEHTLDKFHNDQYQNAPYFVFGDFNFRTDTAGVIKKLTEDTHQSQLSNKGTISKLQFRNNDDNLVLTLGKKEFSYFQHENVFAENSGKWMREYDREMEDFEGRLFEFPIEFVPSYPFEEDITQGSNYMQTRVPAWCDRILLSPTANSLVQNSTSPDAVKYGIIGPTTCMGDHKPVYLHAVLAINAGMLNCCTSELSKKLCFHMLPDSCSNYLQCQPILTTTKTTTNTTTTSTTTSYLHAITIEHDPYTPDSMDSPSPSVFPPSSDIELQELQEYDENYYDNNNKNNNNKLNILKRHDSAVSPALLKSKLELIVKNNNNKKNYYRLHSWPDIKSTLTNKYENDRCYSDSTYNKLWFNKKLNNNNNINTLSDNNINDINKYNNIPKISIIKASNFVLNESTNNIINNDNMTLININNKSHNTSGNCSSFETDLSQDRCDFFKTSSKLSGAHDSGLDTLDVDDGLSQGNCSFGLSSNETTSIFPFDKDEEKLNKYLFISKENTIHDDNDHCENDINTSNDTLKNTDSVDDKIISQNYRNNAVNENDKCCNNKCCVIS
ncbi:inositol polyphosphate-5-phosphatase A isoform X1 [Aphidius gifuensis]|uniref:inositol polyphosphate-5-phosphatase A isoform X1 n=1 Tax=Aphidius gifuensis TaxID=684658 RepID=UPI001CDB498F|nr:inositol polyphosphate-5-phosphatase A isoform X1 [Aphidius gifuensis]